jgi:DNA (cytosine-5)-methyltransferase 1
MKNRYLAIPQGKISQTVTSSGVEIANNASPSTNTSGIRSVAEFFSGIGLMRLGLEKEGWSVVFANDIDEQKVRMYRTHFGDGNECLREDVHEIAVDIIPTTSLATASFPCNDLSLAGSRTGLSGAQSSAFWGFVGIIEQLRERKPPLILIENVPGFLSSHAGRDFRKALLKLNELGYSVDSFVLNATYFVPQSRQRLFVVGVLDQIDGANDQPQIFAESELRPSALSNFIFANPDIRWRIRTLPRPTMVRSTLEDILEPLSSAAPEWWSSERADYLLNQMSSRHREIAEKMIRGKKWSYGTVFRRVRKAKSMAELRVDGIAGCLRTPRGGSGRQILFKAGKGRYFARLLTPRECARLMGADEYKIEAPPNQALFGFGDAVCVPAIRWIAENYLNPIFQELSSRPSDNLYGKKELAIA